MYAGWETLVPDGSAVYGRELKSPVRLIINRAGDLGESKLQIVNFKNIIQYVPHMKQALDCMYISVLTLGGAAALNKAVARQIARAIKAKSAKDEQKMAEIKKRKIEHEGQKCQPQWGNDYFFTEVNGRCICLICNDTVAVMNDCSHYNVQRHYETKPPTYTSYTGVEREEMKKVKKMTASLQSQQVSCRKCHAGEL